MHAYNLCHTYVCKYIIHTTYTYIATVYTHCRYTICTYIHTYVYVYVCKQFVYKKIQFMGKSLVKGAGVKGAVRYFEAV